MDIRFINRKDEIINCSELSIKVMGNSLIGINAEQKIVEIERYGSERIVRERMLQIIEMIKKGVEKQYGGIIIDLRVIDKKGEENDT